MLQTVQSKINFLVSVSTISLSVLTLASLFGLFIVRNELRMTESYDDLLNYALEIRRYEKNFLFYHNAESLKEAFIYLEKVDELVAQLQKDIIRIGGVRSFNEFHANLTSYKKIMNGYLESTTVQEPEMLLIRNLGQELLGFIQDLIKAKRKNIHRAIMRTSILPLAFWIVSVAFTLLGVKLISDRILRPLSLIHLTTERVGRGDFSPVPFDGRGNDEITGLLKAFNQMADELKTNQEHLVQVRKMAALGTFTAGIAHELNNPINNISLTAEAFMDDFDQLTRPECHEMMTDIIEQSARAAEIVKSLLDFSRTEQPAVSTIDLKQVIERTIKLLKNQLLITQVELIRSLPPDLPPILGHFRKLQQVFMNLILNAIQAMPDGGHLEITAVYEDSGMVRVDVTDTGHGISPESLPHIFEPFYTTKGVGQGSGLGLAVTYSLVKRHGGRIEVQSTPDHGTTFSIFLPVASPESQNENA